MTRTSLLLVALLAALTCNAPRAQKDAAPRAVTPRGPLAADELANVELFRRLSPSVVHITTLEQARDFFGRSLQQHPPR
ncbi:MAG: 2-alkenal reductase, partial [Burkholderiales bacterium PBB5]